MQIRGPSGSRQGQARLRQCGRGSPALPSLRRLVSIPPRAIHPHRRTVQGGTAMRVALLSHNARAGDAIGNQVAEKLAFFRERGADVRVVVEADDRLHPALRRYTRVLSPAVPAGATWHDL